MKNGSGSSLATLVPYLANIWSAPADENVLSLFMIDNKRAELP